MDNPLSTPLDCTPAWFGGWVCGVDGNNYGSECIAMCEGVEVAQEGRCPCECNDAIDPVCTPNGITYDNACLAECVGAEVLYEGSCEDCQVLTADDVPWLFTLVEQDSIFCDCAYEALVGCSTYSSSVVALLPGPPCAGGVSLG